MANIAAAQNGAFETGSTWVGGVVPAVNDVAFANNFTVTISDTRTVQAISNQSATGITAGGTYSLLNGCNLTCTDANGLRANFSPYSYSGGILLTTAGLSIGTATINASGSFYTCLSHTSSGTVNWTGNIGAITDNNFVAAPVIAIGGSATFNFTGSVTTGNGGSNNQSGTAIIITGSANVSFVGNMTGNNYGPMIGLSGSASCTITGTVTASPFTGGVAVSNTGGTLTINGACVSRGAQNAISSTSGVNRFSGPLLIGTGASAGPIYANSWRWAPTLTPTYMEVPTATLSAKRNLYTADNMPTGGYPVAANVRQSTIYGPNSEFTGTLAVPSPSAVSQGVPTDNTVGTAVLSASALPTSADIAAAVWSATTRALTDKAGFSLATSPASAADIAAAVWSATTRALTDKAGFSLAISPASAAEIAAAVWSATTRALTDKAGFSLTDAERTAISTAVQAGILNEGDGQLVLNAIVGAIGNVNVNEVALVAAIRADLERTGGVLITRATPQQAAAQVRVELAVELARMLNAATTQEVGTIVEGALTAVPY